jgi:outer membrane protein TolC
MKRTRAIFLCALLVPCVSFAQSQKAPLPETASPSVSFSQAAMKLTLADAEAIALKNNPLISVAKLRSLISNEQVREVRSGLLPDVSLSITGVESRPDSRIAAGGLNNPIVFPRVAVGTTVSQLITDFGRTSNLVSSAQYQAKAEAEMRSPRARKSFLRWTMHSTKRLKHRRSCT